MFVIGVQEHAHTHLRACVSHTRVDTYMTMQMSVPACVLA